MCKPLVVLGFAWAVIGQSVAQSAGREGIAVPGMPLEVVELMARQQDAWNHGDLVGFMDGYWKSDSLVFVGSSGLTAGHQATLARYQWSYPNQEAMGTLTFTNIAWQFLGAESGWLVGRWALGKSTGDDARGMYTLLWRVVEGRWVIVADHSS